MASANDYVRLVAKTPDGARALNYIISTVCNACRENEYYSNHVLMAREEGRKSVGYALRQILGDDLFYAVLSTKI